jgi:hypothetical protein
MDAGRLLAASDAHTEKGCNMKIRYVLSLAILLGLSGMAQAQWLDLGLSNGDFSTPGSYGTLGNGISLSANNGTADNGKLFAGWKAFGGDYSAAASSYSGAAQVTAPPGSGASGKQRGAYIVHDALAGVTIEKTIYKLTFDAKIDTYSYKTYAGLLWGNTDIYNPDTWKSTSYFDFTLDQSDSRRWTSGTWQFTGSPGVSTWTTFTL